MVLDDPDHTHLGQMFVSGREKLADGSIRWAGCDAHGLRKVRDATASDPVLGAEGERGIGSWFDQERVAQGLGLAGDELLARRQRHLSPRVRGFKEWLGLVRPTVLPRSALAEATRYHATRWRPLTAFLRDQQRAARKLLVEARSSG